MAILRLPEVQKITGLRGHSSIYEAIRSGLFPPQIRIGIRSVGWLDDEIQMLCDARIAGCCEDEIRDLVTEMVNARSNRLVSKASPKFPGQF